MIDIIITLFDYAKILLTIGFFTYVYKYFYKSCYEKKIIKTKNGGSKKIVKIKSSLAIIYFILLSLFYYSLNWYVIITFIMSLLLAVTTLLHKFEPSTLNTLKKYDLSPFLMKIWFIYSFIMNALFKLFSPLHCLFDAKYEKIKSIIKNKFSGESTNTHFGNFNLLNNLSNMTTIQNDFDILNNFFENEKKQNIKLRHNNILIDDKNTNITDMSKMD